MLRFKYRSSAGFMHIRVISMYLHFLHDTPYPSKLFTIEPPEFIAFYQNVEEKMKCVKER